MVSAVISVMLTKHTKRIKIAQNALKLTYGKAKIKLFKEDFTTGTPLTERGRGTGDTPFSQAIQFLSLNNIGSWHV